MTEKKINSKKYRNDWLVKLEGTALPILEREMSEEEAHEVVTDFIVAIKNLREKLDPSTGVMLQIEYTKSAMNAALELMDEFGW